MGAPPPQEFCKRQSATPFFPVSFPSPFLTLPFFPSFSLPSLSFLSVPFTSSPLCAALLSSSRHEAASLNASRESGTQGALQRTHKLYVERTRRHYNELFTVEVVLENCADVVIRRRRLVFRPRDSVVTTQNTDLTPGVTHCRKVRHLQQHRTVQCTHDNTIHTVIYTFVQDIWCQILFLSASLYFSKEALTEIGCVVTSLVVGCHARALWPNGCILGI